MLIGMIFVSQNGESARGLGTENPNLRARKMFKLDLREMFLQYNKLQTWLISNKLKLFVSGK